MFFISEENIDEKEESHKTQWNDEHNWSENRVMNSQRQRKSSEIFGEVDFSSKNFVFSNSLQVLFHPKKRCYDAKLWFLLIHRKMKTCRIHL